MNENLKEMLIYAPYLPEDSEEEVMVEMGMKNNSEDVDYEICGEYDFIEQETTNSANTEKDVFDEMPDYFEEEEYAALPVTEADDYEFMPDVNFDIYNAE